MNFSEQFIEIFNFLAQQLGVIIDWTSENVVPYITSFCERFVKYEIATSIAWICIMLVMLLISLLLSIFTTKAHKADQYSEGVIMCFAWFAFIIVALSTFVVIGVQIFDIIKACTIPEQIMIEKMFQIKSQLGY